MIRISLVHQAALGDTVLLIPLLRSLRLRFAKQGIHITLITHDRLGHLLTMLGFADTFASADDPAHTAWFIEPKAMGAPNAQPTWSDCNFLLSAVSNGKDAWSANARTAIPSHAQLLFFEPRPAAAYAGHVTQWHREQLAPLDLSPPPLPVLRNNASGAIVIHAGSGGEAKCWPRERFLTIGRALKSKGFAVTFILGEAEMDRWGETIIQNIRAEFPSHLHMALPPLAEELSRARLFLGNDSGIAQLAAAIGIPVMTLWGPSDDVQWRPVGPVVRVIRAAAPHEHDLNALEESTVMEALRAELHQERGNLK